MFLKNDKFLYLYAKMGFLNMPFYQKIFKEGRKGGSMNKHLKKIVKAP